ncbi:hypothetical protein [Limosilactobacillus ingluviei]|nr:hypothetical protein [Limosilactobacillus ingluviei]
MNPYKEFINWNERKRLIIDYDQNPESPRTSFSNLMKFYTFESRRYSPDEHDFNGVVQGLATLLGEKVYTIHDEENSTDSFFERVVKLALEKEIYLTPISCLDHSVLKYFAGVDYGWDTGCVGYMYATKKDVQNWFGNGKNWQENAANAVEGELKTYNQFVNGEIYMYYLYDENDCIEDQLCDIYADSEKELFEVFRDCAGISLNDENWKEIQRG